MAIECDTYEGVVGKRRGSPRTFEMSKRCILEVYISSSYTAKDYSTSDVGGFGRLLTDGTRSHLLHPRLRSEILKGNCILRVIPQIPAEMPGHAFGCNNCGVHFSFVNTSSLDMQKIYPTYRLYIVKCSSRPVAKVSSPFRDRDTPLSLSIHLKPV